MSLTIRQFIFVQTKMSAKSFRFVLVFDKVFWRHINLPTLQGENFIGVK